MPLTFVAAAGVLKWVWMKGREKRRGWLLEIELSSFQCAVLILCIKFPKGVSLRDWLKKWKYDTFDDFVPTIFDPVMPESTTLRVFLRKMVHILQISKHYFWGGMEAGSLIVCAAMECNFTSCQAALGVFVVTMHVNTHTIYFPCAEGNHYATCFEITLENEEVS